MLRAEARVTDSTREATELRLRLDALAHFGQRELRSIKPSVIQAWIPDGTVEVQLSSRVDWTVDADRRTTSPSMTPADTPHASRSNGPQTDQVGR